MKMSVSKVTGLGTTRASPWEYKVIDPEGRVYPLEVVPTRIDGFYVGHYAFDPDILIYRKNDVDVAFARLCMWDLFRNAQYLPNDMIFDPRVEPLPAELTTEMIWSSPKGEVHLIKRKADGVVVGAGQYVPEAGRFALPVNYLLDFETFSRYEVTLAPPPIPWELLAIIAVIAIVGIVYYIAKRT